MKRLVIRGESKGMHPSEALVEIDTVDGTEELFVDKSIVSSNSIPAWPLDSAENRVLVELPRETMRGRWRVWVRKDALKGA
jgi:hypothetical protein